ncbi:MAG: hypothetical protein ACFFEK_16410 [Candidatus Thorarchaeota archaeon]
MDKSKKRAIFVLYIILFLLSITTVSMIQLHLNTRTSYNLYIEYEKHTATATSLSFDHIYVPVIVNIQVMTDSYQTTLGTVQVSGFPLWVDTSNWDADETVTISGVSYQIQLASGQWKLHHSWSDFEYENIYYRRDIGILVEIKADHMTLGTSGFSGSTVEVTLKQNNINGFASRVTGGNIAANTFLLTGIFIEILIVQWFYVSRKRSKS